MYFNLKIFLKKKVGDHIKFCMQLQIKKNITKTILTSFATNFLTNLCHDPIRSMIHYGR
jgi:hypothetical protein